MMGVIVIYIYMQHVFIAKHFYIVLVKSMIMFSWALYIPQHYTVWMKWIAHFAVGILLLHHYKRDLAHLSDLYSLVIGLYNYERLAKHI